MFSTVATIFQIASAVVAGLIVSLAVIAPLTKSDKDDKALAALRWVEEKLMSLLGALLPGKAVVKLDK